MKKLSEKETEKIFIEIRESCNKAKKLGLDAIIHENRILLRGYKAIAEEIAEIIRANAKILDWGEGFGFLSFILEK